jgi:hypothetical protein
VKPAMQIVVSPCGDVRCVYAEAVNLLSLGDAHVRRASSVEPDERGTWWADLGPAGGPSLGPFGRRSDALSAEEAWLSEHWLLAACAPRPFRT